MAFWRWPSYLGVCALLTAACTDERVVRLLEREKGLGGSNAVEGSGGAEGVGSSTGGAAAGLGGQVVATPITLIDDFADCDDKIINGYEREGSWYHFASPAVYLVNVTYNIGPAPDETWGTQSCGVYLTGGCPDCDAAGLGFQLSQEPWDLSAYTGLRVAFESETSLWAVVVSQSADSSGYTEYVELTATGQLSGERELVFAQMLPGTGFQGFEQAREVQFTVGADDRASFGFGIHRVELF